MVDQVAAGSLPYAELKSRVDDCCVLRLGMGPDRVILKMWNRPGLTGLARRLSRSSPLEKELRGLLLLHRAGVRVPRPIAHLLIEHSPLPYTHALFLEDLGTCTMAVRHLKQLTTDGRREEAEAFLDSCVEMTRRLIASRIIDQDHHFMNIVATESGEAARLDLELAKKHYFVPLPKAPYGEMLGRFIGTYSYAVQPDGRDEVRRFALRVQQELRPPQAVLDRAAEQFGHMRRVEKEKGIDMLLRLPWEEAQAPAPS